MYKTELHMHTADLSVCCATVTYEQAVEEYQQAGYTTIVSTNHINRASILQGDMPWSEKMRYFVETRRKFLELSTPDFHILPGCEVTAKGARNDYLVFGDTDRLLLEGPELIELEIDELCEVVHSYGLLIYQAHPFRHKMRVTKAQPLDGIEVFNGNLRHDSHNFMSRAWAEYHKKPMISGSDYHRPKDAANGGIRTEKPIETNEQLLEVLRSGKYELLEDFSLIRS